MTEQTVDRHRRRFLIGVFGGADANARRLRAAREAAAYEAELRAFGPEILAATAREAEVGADVGADCAGCREVARALAGTGERGSDDER